MLKGFICEKTGDKLGFEDCLACAQSRINRKLDCQFDEAVIAGMIFHQKTKTDISVTMISSCPRGVFISRNYDYYVYPSSLYWAFRGQIAHKIMEEARLPADAIKETRFVRKWEGIEISGTPDLIIPSQGVLKDYKTTKTVPSYLNKDGVISAYENHRVQLNLYRWLIPHQINQLEVVYFSMEETLICPVSPWPDQTTRKSEMTVDRYLEENLVSLKMALDSETMPPYARNWSCESYCDVSEICFRELKQELTAARLRVVKPTKKGATKNGKTDRDKTRRANRSA
jgi:CRISPR/Cas system-associated exonuclease Cas4 (RecB family)